MPDSRRLLQWLALVFALGWFVVLPLRDILTFPDRLSVLPNLETDAAAYDAFARDFASSWDVAVLPSKHPPAWMVVLACVYGTVGHSYVAGKLVSWAALVVSVGLCAWLAHRTFGRTAAIVAALLCASSPGLRGYVGTLQYEVLTSALFTLFLVLSVRAADAPTRRSALTRAALAGLAGGALVLTRETFVLVVPIAATWLWHRQRRGLSTTTARRSTRSIEAVLAAGVLVIVAAAPALGWSAVQTVRHQHLILISDKAQEVFDAGNNPRANGTYNEPLVGIGEPAGVDYIRAFPLDAITLAGRRLLYSFGILHDGWNVPHPVAVWIWRATTGALPLHVIEPIARGGWLLVVCLIALFMFGRAGIREWWLLPATVFAILAVHIVTLASYRFTVPLLPILYVLASGPLARFLQVVLRALRTPAIAAGFALIIVGMVAAQFESWPLRVQYDAVDLDGIAAANSLDDVSGTFVRFADAERGVRPVALLADTYMPRGVVRVTTYLRRTSRHAQDTTAVARVSLQPLRSTTPCVADVLAAQLSADDFVEIAMLCELERDGPVTVAAVSLGQVDLAIRAIELAWIK